METMNMPDVLDVLIVGGGPAGTAAAFRAKELGLDALVIDYDDLLKRIRDYAKDKPILPSFGGGDKMGFPKGGDLIARLHFAPIDKDKMCTDWKGYYRDADIPAQVGVELTGLVQQEDSLWEVQTWNHRTKTEQPFLARHVVIALGRGVPRRFDIPGNTDGIAYRLQDASTYVGEPVCVIGGGTSAAEAVIAISNAKADAGDGCAVYWSYRGDKMPRVSKALSQVFFEAYVGNGNIRYYPRSEPAAVVTASDRKAYLSVRVDRKTLVGRPHETSHLEFDKTFCIACIGEDLPEALLNTMGISLVTGGPRNKKRIAVTPLLESQQPNVYLIGDLLSQAYLEADDFDDDPATFREVKHRGNVKSALRDGVFVAEVIKQKLDGNLDIRVELEYAADPSHEASKETGGGYQVSEAFRAGAGAAEGPPPKSIPDDRQVQEEAAVLVRMTPGGVDEDEFPLQEGGVLTIGRANADVMFRDDQALSDHHASVLYRPEGVYVRDEGSASGTFLRLPPGQSLALADGDLVRLGRQFLVFELQEGRAAFTHYDAAGQRLGHHALEAGSTIVLGRQAPDFTLDAEDLVLSRRHLALSRKGDTVFAKDLKSLNSSYLRVRGERKLEQDEVFRVGQQIFRLSLSMERPVKATTFHVKPTPPSRPPTPPVDGKVPSVAGEAAVTFKNLGRTLVVAKGKTLCDVAEANGIALNAECHAGICGSDPIRILSGGAYLNAVKDDEVDTLADICELEAGNEPGKCRLACMTRATGPVVIEIVAQE